VLPFPVLAKSQIQKRKKAVLLGLFALGVLITIIQIIRIQTVRRLTNYTDSAPLIMWSTVENNLGIIVACIPTLAPLVKYLNERTSGYRNENSRKEVGTRYAMQTWKSGQRKGREPLESGHYEHKDGTSFQCAHIGKGNSTDFILDSAGITKKMVSVTTS
jgi:hypothetical protein